ncbi:hypothetical protein QBC37DRAFT_405449 [Rhypophila decipiens]|uniref:Uncharacterized protein n=1 Tax=Rhypophila decipiens TaxID=261697 RepID=A0AAN6Y2Q1_9PEZI|nr:hypothetical protein QBC37DRAFT_405449 [Rhypophila decipiens]
MSWLMRRQQLLAFHSPTSSFEPFSQFPTEIQDKIWEMAMRGNVMGFHAFFFKPFSPATDGVYSSKCTIYGYNCKEAQELWYPTPTTTKAIILAPRGLGVSQIVRTPDILRSDCWHYLNESMYLEDGGLWLATRGSRSAMARKHVKPAHPSAPAAAATSGAPVPPSKTMSAAITGSFETHVQHIPFHIAKQDVVCIQCDWRAPDVSRFESFSHSILSAFRGVENLAVEFDRWMVTDVHLESPANPGILANAVRYPNGQIAGLGWPPHLRSPFLQLLKAKCQMRGDRPKLWFIDLSLKRATEPNLHAAQNPTRQRDVFEGKFCRFVEVRWGDWDWTGPAFKPSHRCFPDGFFIPECGAHCLLNTIWHSALRPNISDEEQFVIVDWVTKVEFGVLAMENKSDA